MISSVDHFRWRQIPKLRRKAELKVLLDTKLKRGQNQAKICSLLPLFSFNFKNFYEKIFEFRAESKFSIKLVGTHGRFV